MPKFIKATRTIEVTYDFDQIMQDYGTDEAGTWEQIHDYAKEDFGCGWGHTVEIDEIEFVEIEGE